MPLFSPSLNLLLASQSYKGEGGWGKIGWIGWIAANEDEENGITITLTFNEKVTSFT